jgi:hypothetical protein
VSDRAAWLEEWCPECGAAPGSRCRQLARRRHPSPAASLHVARGWRARRCPTCKAWPAELCHTPSGCEASGTHVARLRPGRGELYGDAVWEELERRGIALAVIAFSGRAGKGGSLEAITLVRVDGEELVNVEQSRWPAPLADALKAPVWDRYGAFAGQPAIWGTVRWTVAERRIAIAGRRGGDGFEEVVS